MGYEPWVKSSKPLAHSSEPNIPFPRCLRFEKLEEEAHRLQTQEMRVGGNGSNSESL